MTRVQRPRAESLSMGLRLPVALRDRSIEIAEMDGRTLGGQIRFLLHQRLKEYEAEQLLLDRQRRSVEWLDAPTTSKGPDSDGTLAQKTSSGGRPTDRDSDQRDEQ